MLKTLRALLPLIILTGCVWAGYWFLTNKPEQKTMEIPPVIVSVEGLTLKKTTYAVKVPSQGTVRPRTQSTLLPEVAGKITETNAAYSDGKRVTLMEMDFNKLLANPEKMKALTKANPKTIEEMKALVKGVDGVKVETAPAVKIKFQ